MEDERTILIVDDSTAMRAFIISGLEELGNFTFVEAKTGFEALKELPRKKYTLIISDINMPDINGLELLNFIKTSENYKDIPVLMISTETKEEDLNRALTMGANDYLTKPFDLKTLQKKVKKLLGLK